MHKHTHTYARGLLCAPGGVAGFSSDCTVLLLNIVLGNGVEYENLFKSASQWLKLIPAVWIWSPMVILVPKMPKLEIFIFHPVTGARAPRPNREPSPRRTNYEKVLKIQIPAGFMSVSAPHWLVVHGDAVDTPTLPTCE